MFSRGVMLAGQSSQRFGIRSRTVTKRGETSLLEAASDRALLSSPPFLPFPPSLSTPPNCTRDSVKLFAPRGRDGETRKQIPRPAAHSFTDIFFFGQEKFLLFLHARGLATSSVLAQS